MTVEEAFEFFMACLRRAGVEMEDHYFQLPVAELDEPVYRERVYCYELYHQLRRCLGDHFPWKLHGEVDKEKHPIIHPELGPKKPDFIVHRPDKMDNNLIVIEVKSLAVKDRIQDLRDDIKKLKGFLTLKKGAYYRGIMLIYGDGQHEIPENIVSEFNRTLEGYEDCLLLIWHRGFQEEPSIVN